MLKARCGQTPVNDVLLGRLSCKEFPALSSMVARLAPCGDKAIGLLWSREEQLKGAGSGANVSASTKGKGKAVKRGGS
jgi:hypothetical protein